MLINQAYGDWLQGFEWQYFVTHTFAPRERGYVGSHMAFKYMDKWAREVTGWGTRQAEYFVVAEPHKWRDDCHLHALVKGVDLPAGWEARIMQGLWHHGFSRVLPINDRGALYVAKYLTKTNDVPIDIQMERRSHSAAQRTT